MGVEQLVIGERLPDLCTPFLAFVLELEQSDDPGDGAALRARLERALGDVQQGGLARGVPEDVLAQARYALIALVDEVVLTSNWPLKQAWLGRPLQLEHFGSFAAGEEFFTRLDAIRGAQSAHRLELIEVYALCLCFGFKGKHGGVQGMSALADLQRALVEELKTAEPAAGPSQGAAVSARDVAIGRSRRKVSATGLSPGWRPPAAPIEITRDLPVRPAVVACLACLALVYGVLAWWLGASSAAVAARIGAGG